jgi:uncharacterized protein
MIKLGQRNSLTATRNAAAGMYLADKKGEEVLLPNKYVPKSLKVGELLDVFVYNDSEDRPVATTLVPLIELGEIAPLTVKEITTFGAFMDWGMEKDLLVPVKEQLEPMKENQTYLVHLYLDELTQRLVGSTKIKKFLSNETLSFKAGDAVEGVIFDDTPLGYLVAVNNKFMGLLYHNEVYHRVKIGDSIQAYVKKVKDNKELDLSMQKIGFKHVDDSTEIVLNHIKQNKGFLNLGDSSSPGEIQARLNMSKKVFKKAIGILYKQKKIRIEPEGVYLTKSDKPFSKGPRENTNPKKSF